MRPQRGDVLGSRYRLTEPIAVGGMGEVWRAADETLSRDVAVKILKEEYTGDPGFLERFRSEARHTAALAHPNIAITYDYGEASGSAYLVMELVPGRPMSDVLADEAPLEPRRAAGLLAQAAHGLSAAHAAGVVHRDVKPGNLLVTPDGRVKVTDFGIARAADAVPLTRTGQVMGTAQYLAPEQAMGRPPAPASDVYALGVVGYELLTGERPFSGDSQVAVAMAHVNDDPPTLPVRLPTGLRALIERSMMKDPGRRPADAGQFARAADAAARGDDDAVLAMLGGAAAVAAAAAPPTGEATQVLPPPPVRAAEPGRGQVSTPVPVPPPQRGRRRMTGPLLALLALVLFLVVGAFLAGEAFGPQDTVAPTVTDVVTQPGAGTAPGTGPAPEEPTGPTEPGSVTSTPSGTPTTTGPSPTTTTSAPAGIEVVAADYVGRPRGPVVGELEGLGLVVQVEEQAGTDEQPGTVLAVSEGTFSPGDSVTVTVAQAPGQPTNDDEDG